MSPTTEQKWEQELPVTSLPQICQSYWDSPLSPPDSIPPPPIHRSHAQAESPERVSCKGGWAPSPGKDVVHLVWSVPSPLVCGLRRPWNGKSMGRGKRHGFSNFYSKAQDSPLKTVKVTRNKERLSDSQTGGVGEMRQLGAVWTGCQGLCNSNVPGSPSFWIWQMYCCNRRH